MYAAFLISGLVDLIGFYAPAGTVPPGTEHVRAHALIKDSLQGVLTGQLLRSSSLAACLLVILACNSSSNTCSRLVQPSSEGRVYSPALSNPACRSVIQNVSGYTVFR